MFLVYHKTKNGWEEYGIVRTHREALKMYKMGVPQMVISLNDKKKKV